MGVVKIYTNTIWGSSSGLLYAILETVQESTKDEVLRKSIGDAIEQNNSYFNLADLGIDQRRHFRDGAEALVDAWRDGRTKFPPADEQTLAMLDDLVGKLRAMDLQRGQA